jgi:hypothetical protein
VFLWKIFNEVGTFVSGGSNHGVEQPMWTLIISLYIVIADCSYYLIRHVFLYVVCTIILLTSITHFCSTFTTAYSMRPLPTGAIFRCYPGYVDNCFFQFIYDPAKYSSEKVQKSKCFMVYLTGSGKYFMTIQIGQIGICLPENSQAVLMQQILR